MIGRQVIGRLLVANRGEIARRIFRTCRDLGISTIAVFGDPDAGAPHAAEADLAVRLRAERAYLDIDAVIAAAKESGADAVHPGYGFLSENPEFARAVLDAGLTWIGPPPPAIAAMGSKIEAKRLMQEAGVPVLSGDLRYPLLIKASAGGGGRGMRIVGTPGELDEAMESARREAESAFGDPAVFVEPYLENARHIEVQILADQHGTVWALGERECSIQRRHQKVVEEAPSPGVSPDVREALCAAGIAAAEAIGYTGAGTVEFLLAGDGFFFLEMNTRLQVEHPVTELLYDVDLVRAQLEIAEGVRLAPAPPQPRGHAVEARLYAEDPAAGYRPQSGTLHRFEIPGDVRVDSGVESGGTVSTHYDPMLAKVIACAPTRAAAVRKLAAALASARLHGLITNRDQLVRVLRHPAFTAGDTDTGFLGRHDVTAPLADAQAVRLSALAAALADAAANREAAPVLSGIPSGWRNVGAMPQRKEYDEGAVDYRITRDGLVTGLGAALVRASPGEVVLETGGVHRRFSVARYGSMVCVDSSLGPVTLTARARLPGPAEDVAPGSLLSPMPGSVIRVAVTPGERVEQGRTLFVLEAMKMEHRIEAPHAGVVGELHVESGQQIEADTVLAVIEPADPDEPA